jgi:hypothetical protein
MRSLLCRRARETRCGLRCAAELVKRGAVFVVPQSSPNEMRSFNKTKQNTPLQSAAHVSKRSPEQHCCQALRRRYIQQTQSLRAHCAQLASVSMFTARFREWCTARSISREGRPGLPEYEQDFSMFTARSREWRTRRAVRRVA